MNDALKPLSLDDIRGIATWARTAGLGEIELEQPGLRLRLVFSATGGLHLVRSPIAGRFLDRHPARPDPFARPGDRVGARDVIGLIQVERLYRPVVAGRAGVLVRLLVETGRLIDADMPLAEITTETEGRHGTRS